MVLLLCVKTIDIYQLEVYLLLQIISITFVPHYK